MRLTPRVAGAVAVFARVVVAAAGGYAAGARQRGDSPAQVDHTPGEIQATLQFNHLLEYRRLEKFLLAGCSAEALAQLKFDVDLQMGLVAELRQAHPSAWADHDMSALDPGTFGELGVFKSAYGNSWNEPVCKAQAAASGSVGQPWSSNARAPAR